MAIQDTARRTRRQALRRQQVLEAAAAVFARVGYVSATLELIGEEVGLSKTSLYYYVTSKEDLLASLVVTAIEAIETHFARLRPSDADPRVEFEAFVRAHVGVACTLTGQVVCQNLDFVFRDQPNQDMVAARRRHQASLRGILERGVEQQLFRAVDVRTVTALVLAALNTVPLWARSTDDPKRLAREAAQLALNGLLLPETARVP